MSGLNLVISDKDQSYLDSVIDFINSKYQNRFYVQAFSNESDFFDYVNQVDKIDILLISSDFYSYDLPWGKIVAAIVLSSGILLKEIKNCEVISKYQTGDKLVASILNIFSEKSKHEVFFHDGNQNTKIYTFFSPCGGSGKSTLAIGASVQYACSGMEVFYLNLERFPTTNSFFSNQGMQNLSNVLFYLKENNKNLALKIEGSRSIDPETGVHYFAPPENVFDIDDITKDEVDRLFNQFKSLGCYDRVIIDTTSELNDINISVFEKSDMIFAVLPCHSLAKVKLDYLQRAFEILEKRRGIRLLEKIELILNECNDSSSPGVEDIEINNKPALLSIPYIKGFDIRLGPACLKDCKNPIGSAVSQIVNKF